MLPQALGSLALRSAPWTLRQGRGRSGRAASWVGIAGLCLLVLAPPARSQTPPGFPFGLNERAPSLDNGSEWINTPRPLAAQDLRGKFVLLDFWTYCCINCMHILPELKKLEHAYPKNLVVIGVHSGKFDNERDAENIRQAVLRYEIEHPIVNDPDYVLWTRFGVDSWPTLRLIDPEGNLVGGVPGEVEFESLDRVLKNALPYYRRKGVLDETPLVFNFEQLKVRDTPLRFPGKVLADAEGNRLFIADSNHNRIVVSRLDGTLVDVIGSGAAGRADGGYREATFDNPQGMAVRRDTLYVADTDNHLVRKIDLAARRVETVAGVGRQRRENTPSARRHLGVPARTALNSPWALAIHGADLYVAMAGPHQVWKMALDESRIGVHAGSGREDIVDGPLLPRASIAEGAACFAQPSGLATDGKWLYVADSEGSSIRSVPFDTSRAASVTTLVGTAHLPAERLFTYGDLDGPSPEARLQHPLDVACYKGLVYVADTYNNKLKVLDPRSRTIRTIAGTGEAGSQDKPAMFDEPGGTSAAGGKLYVADTNNHLVRVIELDKGYKVSTLAIRGLEPPSPSRSDVKPTFPAAKQVRLKTAEVKAADGAITLSADLVLPAGYHPVEQIPMRYWIEATEPAGPIDRGMLEKLTPLPESRPHFEISVPVTAREGEDTLKVALVFYYCAEGKEALCKVGSVIWTVPVRLSAAAKSNTIQLNHRVQ